MKTLNNLAGRDSLGRPLVQPERCPAPRAERLVGMFYFLWCGEGDGWRHKPYDISRITAADPQAGYKPDSDVWGGIGTMHHWGEPLYGYYYSDDEWVIRKHMKLLIEADIDFLFFDTTNALIYENNAKTVMRVLKEYHDDGFKIPQVMFYTNSASGQTVQRIYDAVYRCNYCPETWFYFGGKPVIIAKAEECSPETRDFFNIKKSQWPNEPDKLGGWPWMDFTRPQRVFANDDGADEVINVSVAQHPQLRFGDSVLYGERTNCGRAYHNGFNDSENDGYLYGYNFAEQFERAIEADPPVVLVTGWNEWIAGRWQGPPQRPLMFVDCANYEYSRDIEMMRGGYFDNYFMQLISYVRRYKGTPQPTSYAPGESAVYHNFPDGTFERDCDGYGTHFVNKTGVNSIREITVCRHDRELDFTVRCARDIVPHGGDCIKIFIGAGEAGYSHIIESDGAKARIIKAEDSFTGSEYDEIRASFDGRCVTYTVPEELLSVQAPYTLRFKVCDSSEKYTCVEDFYEKGDVAPLGTPDFVYRAKD